MPSIGFNPYGWIGEHRHSPQPIWMRREHKPLDVINRRGWSIKVITGDLSGPLQRRLTMVHEYAETNSLNTMDQLVTEYWKSLGGSDRWILDHAVPLMCLALPYIDALYLTVLRIQKDQLAYLYPLPLEFWASKMCMWIFVNWMECIQAPTSWLSLCLACAIIHSEKPIFAASSTLNVCLKC